MVRNFMAVYRKAAEGYLAAHGGELCPDGCGGGGSVGWSDSWLLLAIKIAQGESTQVRLEDIFAAGDMLNHAIFTADELEAGFLLLKRNGLLAIDGDQCALTHAFFDVWTAMDADGLSMSKQWDAVRRILGT